MLICQLVRYQNSYSTIFRAFKKYIYKKKQGSPYRLNIKGKYLKEINKPNFGQIGVPYVLDSKNNFLMILSYISYTRRLK